MANKILNYESNGWMAVVTYQNLTSIIGERGQEKGQEMVQKNRKGTERQKGDRHLFFHIFFDKRYGELF